MKVSWFFVVLLLIFVAIFSVQNADVITIRLFAWEFSLSAALLIQLAALLGAFVGIGIGLRARRPAPPAPPAPVPAPREPIRSEEEKPVPKPAPPAGEFDKSRRAGPPGTPSGL